MSTIPSTSMPPPTAAAGLDNVTGSRQERLLGRPNREMVDSTREVQSGWWGGLATFLYTLALLDLFLVLMLLKLETEESTISWWLVATPLWVLQGLGLTKDFFRYYRYSSPGEDPPSVYLFVYRMLHGSSLAISTLLVTIRLEGVLLKDVPWSLILCPMWVDAVVGSAILWFAPPPPSFEASGGSTRDYRQNMLNAGLFHVVAWGLQVGLVAMKLDGTIDGSWSNIFVPSFLMLIMMVIVLVGTSFHLLATFCPMCLRFLSISRAGRLVMVELGVVLVLVWAWIICLFHSFDSLVELLSRESPTTVSDVLLPTIGVASATLVLIPVLVAAAFSIGLTEQALADAVDGGHQEQVAMTPLMRPIQMWQLSSTYFKRVGDDLSRSTAGGDAMDGGVWPGCDEDIAELGVAKMCYVCETNAANAVLLDCGHGGICYEDATGLLERGNRMCPICRDPVQHVVKLPDDVVGTDGTHPPRGNRIIEVSEGFSILSSQPSTSTRGRRQSGASERRGSDPSSTPAARAEPPPPPQT